MCRFTLSFQKFYEAGPVALYTNEKIETERDEVISLGRYSRLIGPGFGHRLDGS